MRNRMQNLYFSKLKLDPFLPALYNYAISSFFEITSVLKNRII